MNNSSIKVQQDLSLLNIDIYDAMKYLLSINKIKKREVLIIKQRLIDKTLEQIGCDIGVTRERVRQLESSGCRKLLHPMVKKYKKDINEIKYF